MHPFSQPTSPTKPAAPTTSASSTQPSTPAQFVSISLPPHNFHSKHTQLTSFLPPHRIRHRRLLQRLLGIPLNILQSRLNRPLLLRLHRHRGHRNHPPPRRRHRRRHVLRLRIGGYLLLLSRRVHLPLLSDPAVFQLPDRLLGVCDDSR